MKTDLVHRVIGAAALAFVGWQVGTLVGSSSEQARNAGIGAGAGVLVGLIIAPYLITRPYEALRRLVSRTPPGEFVYGVLGLIIGLLAGALLSYPLSLLPWWFGHVLPAAAAVVCAYLGVTFLTMRRTELTSYIRSRFRDHSGSADQEGAYLIDTSAIIDGRIADITQAGFLFGSLVVPRFVLSELQHIADSPDSLRRARGRRGLEILNRLQKDSASGVNIVDSDPHNVAEVDGKLVKLAREMSCPVITNDFNLNRIAELEGVRVLNINQLANAVKPLVLPGEEMGVRIIQEGKEINQGVGYLDDGTMIVVENGRRFIHSDIEVIVTRVLQTVAGRMIFAQPKSNGRD
jgi:uncharacterized protein YacL